MATNKKVLKPFFICRNSDAVDFLRLLPDQSVDLVVTDPPYESLEKHRKIGTTTRLKNSKASSNAWFEIFHNSRFLELFTEVHRVLKPNRHFYMLCDQDTMFVARPLIEEAGFNYYKFLIWNKEKIGMGYNYRAMHELILFSKKGKRKLNSLSIPDVLSVPRVFRGYPTEKPVGLLEILVSQSTLPGEIVVDPFMGSGTSGVAAVKLGRHFIGNDKCKEATQLSVRRIKEAGGRKKFKGWKKLLSGKSS